MENKNFSELYPELAQASIEFHKNKKKKTIYSAPEKIKEVVIQKPCNMNIFKNLY